MSSAPKTKKPLLSPGKVLLILDYDFDDGGEQKSKFFVVLNTADSNTPALLLKTTSTLNKYSNMKVGCNIRPRGFSGFFVSAGTEKAFSKKK